MENIICDLESELEEKNQQLKLAGELGDTSSTHASSSFPHIPHASVACARLAFSIIFFVIFLVRPARCAV